MFLLLLLFSYLKRFVVHWASEDNEAGGEYIRGGQNVAMRNKRLGKLRN